MRKAGHDSPCWPKHRRSAVPAASESGWCSFVAELSAVMHNADGNARDHVDKNALSESRRWSVRYISVRQRSREDAVCRRRSPCSPLPPAWGHRATPFVSFLPFCYAAHLLRDAQPPPARSLGPSCNLSPAWTSSALRTSIGACLACPALDGCRGTGARPRQQRRHAGW